MIETGGKRSASFIVFFPAGTVGGLAEILFDIETTGNADIAFLTAEGQSEARFEGERVSALFVDALVRITRAADGGGPRNRAPVANAGSDRNVNEGATVSLDASASSDADGDNLTFAWQQVGGEPVELADADTDSPSFIVPDNGTFTFRVTVSDGQLDSTDDVIVSAVNVVPAVNAGADRDAIQGQPLTLDVTFADPSSVDTEAGHAATIDWGDGTGVTTIDPATSPFSAEHTYELEDLPAQVTVTVSVTDKDNGTGTDTVVVTVAPSELQPPEANAGADQTVNEGDLVSFTGLGSVDLDGDIVSYAWDFGDGETGVGAIQAHTYDQDGTFFVTLTVTDNDDLIGEAIIVVTVENVAPVVVPGAAQAGTEGSRISVSATFADVGVEDSHTATIDWADGTTTTLDPARSPLSAEHVYRNDGEFVVTITVSDEQDSGSATLEVNLDDVAPRVDAGDPLAGLVNDEIQLTARLTDAGADDTHTAQINWGDGTTTAGTVTIEDGSGTVAGTHTYLSDGVFTVTVTVTDIEDDDVSGTDTTESRIVEAAPLTAGLAGSELQLRLAGQPLEDGARVNAGQPIAATFRITNTGTDATPAGTEVQLFVNGVAHATFDAGSLAGGASKGFRIPSEAGPAITQTSPGIVVVQVGTEISTFVVPEAVLTISELEVIPRVAGSGIIIEISAVATNDGGVDAIFPVDVRVDNSSEVSQLTLAAGGTADVIRLIQVPDELPATGITSAGSHEVLVDGQTDRYRVNPPAIRTPIPTSYNFDPNATTSFDENGNTLVAVSGEPITIGLGSITLGIPVRAARGVKVASFVDTASGLSIIGRDVSIPLRDPVTGELLVKLKGTLQSELEGNGLDDPAGGTFESLTLETDERSEDLSTDDERVGTLSASVSADLESLPAGVNVEMTITKQLDNEDRTKAELEVRQEEQGLRIANEAGVVTVNASELTPDDLGVVRVETKISFRWILQFGAANVRFAIVHDDGSVELVKAGCDELPDANLEIACRAETEGGFSEFSLLALAKEPANFVASNLTITPEVVEPGEPVKITVDIENQGVDFDSFSAILEIKGPDDADFAPVAVRGIPLAGGERGTLRFFVPAAEIEGPYDVRIENLSRSYEVARIINLEDLRIENLAIRPATVEPGQPVSITADVLTTVPKREARRSS